MRNAETKAPKGVRKYLARIGAKGGKASAGKPKTGRDRESFVAAARARWDRVRELKAEGGQASVYPQ